MSGSVTVHGTPRGMGAVGCAVLASLLVAPGAVFGQDAGSPELTTFLAELDAAGRRFSDVEVAIAEGYRKLGPDFPGMGEHWVNPGLVIRGELDPERPPLVAYTHAGGERRLVAFGYTRVLGPDESPPEDPFPGHTWHDHTGGVDEESLLLAGPASMHGDGDGYRLSMVHVWLGAENPDGALSQNNWALPFWRLGVTAPSRTSSEAARAFSLSTEEGRSFYDQLLRDGVGLEGVELESATEVFLDAARDAGAIRARLSSVGYAAEDDLRALESIWAEIWNRLEAELSSETVEELTVLRS